MLPEKKEENREEVVFNMGIFQLQLIGNYIARATRAYVNFNTRDCFTSLKAIKIQIFPRLNKEEREILMNLEKTIYSIFGKYQKGDTDLVKKYNNKIDQELIFKIEEYFIKIQVLLDSCGYMMPLKSKKGSVFGKYMESG